MAKILKIDQAPCSVQVHVDENTVVEVMTGEQGFFINIFRNGEGWKEILFDQYQTRESGADNG